MKSLLTDDYSTVL